MKATLEPCHDADGKLLNAGQSFCQQSKHHRFSGTGIARDHGEATIQDQVLYPVAERFHPGRHDQAFMRDIEGKRIQLEIIRGKDRLILHDRVPYQTVCRPAVDRIYGSLPSFP